MLLQFRRPRSDHKEPRPGNLSAPLGALLDDCRSRRSSMLRERLRLRASIARLRRLARRMSRTQLRLGASLRRLAEIDRRAVRGGPPV